MVTSNPKVWRAEAVVTVGARRLNVGTYYVKAKNVKAVQDLVQSQVVKALKIEIKTPLEVDILAAEDV